MEKKVLVPLGRYDGSEEMIPYLQKFVRPGIKVVFLMRYPMGGVRPQKEAYGLRAALKAKDLARDYSWEANVAAATAEIAPACEALRVQGAEVIVELYGGSLKKKIRSYTVAGDVHLILTRAGAWQRIFALLNGQSSFVDLLSRRMGRPVLLIEPAMGL
jgi:hypothetical protein